MNSIIIYSSKYGCTADCAKYLKSQLSGSVVISDIDSIKTNAIVLENYDTIILGASIYIGAISKKMKNFCNENIDVFSKKRVGIFLCSGYPEQTKEYLTANFSPILLKSAIVIKNFGGEARIDKMKYIDKLIVKAVTKGDYSEFKILQESMDSFVTELK